MITKDRKILYECDISQIRSIDYGVALPLLEGYGALFIENRKKPIPKDFWFGLDMSWFSYKRVEKRIKQITESQRSGNK